jgi:hypothetical protein
MSSGTKVYKYRCNKCERTVELVSDNRRPDPSRCVITEQCRGTLDPLGSRRGDRARLTTPVAELVDRIPRGTTVSITEAAADPTLVTLSTFNNMNGLTIAGPRRTVVGAEAIYSLQDSAGVSFELERRPATAIYEGLSHINMMVYELTAAVLSSQKYTYTFRSIAQLIEGIDSSKEQRLLRFGSLDTLKVLVNGIELSPAAYDRTQGDSIRLTPSITAAEIIIDVYVFKNRAQLITEVSLIKLVFKALTDTIAIDRDLRSGCAWGDIARLTTPDSNERALLFCTDLKGLEQRKTYSVARFEAVNTGGGVRVISPSEIWMLLSDAPHSFIDKRLDEVINGISLVQQEFNFTHDLSEATGDLVPVTNASALTLLSTRLAPKAEAAILPTSTLGAERVYAKRPIAYIIGPA